MDRRPPPQDWTLAWRGASALALSTWTLHRERLSDPHAARLLEAALALTALGRRLSLHGYVVLPGALHLVAALPAAGSPAPLAPWPTALGQVKGLFARWDNRRLALTGRVWKPGARVRPLTGPAVLTALVRCHAAPVRMGLAPRPDAWPHSSAAALAGGRAADPLLRPPAGR